MSPSRLISRLLKSQQPEVGGESVEVRDVELRKRQAGFIVWLPAPTLVDNLVVAGCNSCGAPLRLDRDRGLLVCRHCGAEEQLPAAVGELELLDESARLCPVCAVPLSNSRLEGSPLLFCTICLGMLIEMNRFVAIIEAVRAHEGRSVQTMSPRRQNPEDRALACPACGRPMVAHLYGGPGNIVIDTCERCLVNWLDSAELRRIAVAPDRRRST